MLLALAVVLENLTTTFTDIKPLNNKLPLVSKEIEGFFYVNTAIFLIIVALFVNYGRLY
jgi:hypothetical protein